MVQAASQDDEAVPKGAEANRPHEPQAASSMAWPEYLIGRAIESPVLELGVVPGSTPVVSFGDPISATVATLGINPSHQEFLDGTGRLLDGPKRRLATLRSLGVERYEELTAEHGAAIVDDCAGYFERRPYRWFNPLNDIIKAALGASYFDGSACHLDLVQWATQPAWGKLAPDVQNALLRQDVEFLRRQLGQTDYDLVVVNGRSVVRRVAEAGLVTWRHLATVPNSPPAEFIGGYSEEGSLFLGWSCNLQSQHGAPRHTRRLIELVTEHAVGRTLVTSARTHAEALSASTGDTEHQQTGSDDQPRSPAPTDMDVIPQGIHFANKDDLVAYLDTWLKRSTSPTIGDVGTYGGKLWITVDSDVGVININSDTKHEAIEALVDDARSRSDDLEWVVIENRSGRLNKVLFTTGTTPTPGWYAYLRKELDGAGPVRVGRTGISGVDVAEPSSDRSEASSVPVEEPTPRVRVRPSVSAGSTPPTAAMSGSAAIVHFPHPGGEHVPRGDTMPWNTGNHRRKFLTSPGTYIDDEGQRWRDEIVFWGEWEAQSRVVRRWSRRPRLPTVLHAPYWSPPGYEGERQNTDPWVFGDAFLYSNCRQFSRAHGTATAMQGIPAGSMILFGSTRSVDFVLDTVFVVGQVVGRYQPMTASDYLTLDAAFDFCTIQSLADYAPDLASATLTLYRGATVDNPVEGMYSFVPCRRRHDPDLRFPRPAVDLPGIINPRSKQSPAGAKILRPISEVGQAWHDVAVQVEAADLLLGVQIDTPERKPAPNP